MYLVRQRGGVKIVDHSLDFCTVKLPSSHLERDNLWLVGIVRIRVLYNVKSKDSCHACRASCNGLTSADGKILLS